MINESQVRGLIDDISYELNVEHYMLTETYLDNPFKLKKWLEAVKDSRKLEIKGNKDAQMAVERLEALIENHENLPVEDIPKNDIKGIYINLVDGAIRPRLTTHMSGRYQLEDSELCDSVIIDRSADELRKSACSTEFIHNIIKKYKPKNSTELAGLFVVNRIDRQ